MKPLITFAPPGPGSWRRLGDHFPRPVTAEYRRLYTETCPPGMATYMERYGVLARTLAVGFVLGHLYVSPVPLAGPRAPKRTPPTAAVWLMARAHPTFRHRNKAAERALRDRPWRGVAEQWFEAEREEWWQRDVGLDDIDPVSLDDEQLAAHLGDARQLVVDGYRRHFELHGDDLLPIGLLLARCHEWGIPPDQVTGALRTAVPADTVPATSPWILATGYDLDCLTWGETGRTPPASSSDPTPCVDVSALAPTSAGEELAMLLEDARLAVALRDDNGVLTAAWPMGLLRRAMLEAGRRLHSDDPPLVVDATVHELVGALAGNTPLDIADIARRRHDRDASAGLDAPDVLGPTFTLPPLAALPRPLARIGAAQLAAADHMATGDHAIGVGRESFTGRALVAEDPTVAILTFEPGDVVITTATSPTWNALLEKAGALVTANGGLVSHAAVTARELGIAAVVGDRSACRRLRTGMTVTVDPVRATVEIVT